MNSKSIALKLRIITIAIVLLAIFVTVYSGFLIYNKNTMYPTVNKGRILTNSIKLDIEEALSKNDFDHEIESPYYYAVIDLSGKVLSSTINEYKKDDLINFNDFVEYDNKTYSEEPGLIKYSAPVAIDNKQVGTAIFLIPRENCLPISPGVVTILNLLPIIICLIIISILSIYIYVFSKKDILVPLTTLHQSACRILKGDFSYKIEYDYDSEIGGFCHDFEAMRDEIKSSKKRELEIRVNEKELLGCLAHDIKTPLTAINAYLLGIKDGIVKDKAGIDNYCKIILKRIKMLTKLLDDILEHSKAELNKMNVLLSEIYCGDFFKDILEDLSVEAQSAGLEFMYSDKIPNLLISVDKKRISQVMYNLVSNSIKYSKKNGVISINFEVSDDYLYVYVEDTGIGISSADIPYIFNKFYRGEKSRNQNIPGSGLGLSISKYIIEAHGGFINCVKSSSDGTIICFTLPI